MSKETKKVQDFMNNINNEEVVEVLQFILDKKYIESGLDQFIKFKNSFDKPVETTNKQSKFKCSCKLPKHLNCTGELPNCYDAIDSD